MPIVPHYTCLCGKELSREDEDKMMEELDGFVAYLREQYGGHIGPVEFLAAKNAYKKAAGRPAASAASA